MVIPTKKKYAPPDINTAVEKELSIVNSVLVISLSIKEDLSKQNKS